MSHPLHLKVELALRGARLDPSARERTSLRNGQGLAVELELPGAISVGVPVDERHAATSPFELVAADGGLLVRRRDRAGAAVAVRAARRPRFYGRQTSRGIPMARIAAVHGSHLLVRPGSTCGFSVRGTPCPFCLEGARAPAERDAVPVADVLEVVRAAFDEGACETVYFNTGFFDGEDGGITFLEPYVQAVRKHFDTLIATQVHPPRSDRWIDRTYAMGVDALSYNLELFDPELLKRHCIGRARYIGRERYLEALAYAAGVFPSGTVWSDLVVGLEPAESTRAGIAALADMGVVPVVVFPYLEQIVLDPETVTPLLGTLFRAVRERGINMGWVRDLTLGVTPFEARHFAGDGARLAVAMQAVARSRLGSRAARGLARLRRRLRVKSVSESFDAAHL